MPTYIHMHSKVRNEKPLRYTMSQNTISPFTPKRKQDGVPAPLTYPPSIHTTTATSTEGWPRPQRPAIRMPGSQPPSLCSCHQHAELLWYTARQCALQAGMQVAVCAAITRLLGGPQARQHPQDVQKQVTALYRNKEATVKIAQQALQSDDGGNNRATRARNELCQAGCLCASAQHKHAMHMHHLADPQPPHPSPRAEPVSSSSTP